MLTICLNNSIKLGHGVEFLLFKWLLGSSSVKLCLQWFEGIFSQHWSTKWKLCASSTSWLKLERRRTWVPLRRLGRISWFFRVIATTSSGIHWERKELSTGTRYQMPQEVWVRTVIFEVDVMNVNLDRAYQVIVQDYVPHFVWFLLERNSRVSFFLLSFRNRLLYSFIFVCFYFSFSNLFLPSKVSCFVFTIPCLFHLIVVSCTSSYS